MHTFLWTYIKRDDYCEKFKTNVAQNRAILMKRGIPSRMALKQIKRAGWRFLRDLEGT